MSSKHSGAKLILTETPIKAINAFGFYGDSNGVC